MGGGTESTSISWNVTNNTFFTNSNFTGYTAVNFTSGNQSTMLLSFMENGTSIYSFTATNGTNYFINLTNLSNGINWYWWHSALNDSGNYSLTILPASTCFTNNWDCTESCSVGNLDAGGNQITATGSGTIQITGNVTNCATGSNRLRMSGGCKVIVRHGGGFCKG
jgi:hypothetical protein